MRRIAAIIKKDIVLVSRDVHALGVLFIFPFVFIVVMSLALQDVFDSDSERKIRIGIHIEINNADTEQFIANLDSIPDITVVQIDTSVNGSILDALRRLNCDAALVVSQSFSSFVRGDTSVSSVLRCIHNPSSNAALHRIIYHSVREILRLMRFQNSLQKSKMYRSIALHSFEQFNASTERAIDVEYAYASKTTAVMPSSVQQNTPAWLIFAMFLISIPVANTFITERSQGTLMRLHSMNVPPILFVTGKFVPFFIINMIQVVTMLATGRFIVQLLGGEPLHLGNSFFALALLSASVSACAIWFAIFIALISKTTEHAVVIGGFGNLLFGALGGIMVPSFLMPPLLQKIGMLSPMRWGLEGFLDILLRTGDISDIIPETLVLLGMSFAAAFVAVMIMKNGRTEG
jgi:ABC-2 type transport system permease protein